MRNADVLYLFTAGALLFFLLLLKEKALSPTVVFGPEREVVAPAGHGGSLSPDAGAGVAGSPEQEFSPTCFIRDTCERSKACQSVDLHRRTPVMHDNVRAVGAVDEGLRTQLRGKHLRIRVVQAWKTRAGFFTYPMYVANQLRFARRFGFIAEKEPFVYMPETNQYFQSCAETTVRPPNAGKAFPDLWETWFKPISRVKYWEVREEDVWEFNDDTIAALYRNKDGIHYYPYRTLLRRPGVHYTHGMIGTPMWINCERSRMFPLLRQVANIREGVYSTALAFFRAHFKPGQPVLGLHMRGTDKVHNKKLGPLDYAKEIEHFRSQHPNGKAFLATDDSAFLSEALRKFGKDFIVYRNVSRSQRNILYDANADKYKKAEDVVVDSLVLSMCSKLVKCFSAVSEFSIYFYINRRQLHPQSFADALAVTDLEATAPNSTLELQSTCQAVPRISESILKIEAPTELHGWQSGDVRHL
mmetsp:Transcript_12367/g.30442  ORF Transcript_12367/g.30442 Transcript_12367/m.30442 type:complete len:471 (+) Transcript_12367:191-1603(+)